MDELPVFFISKNLGACNAFVTVGLLYSAEPINKTLGKELQQK